MLKHEWSHLDGPQRVGEFGELLVSLELTRQGFEIFKSAVDDRGIDLLVRLGPGCCSEVQVKTIRGMNYVFVRKQHFALNESRSIALVVLLEGQEPLMYLIPSLVWQEPVSPFVDRDYEGLKSQPEYGINISRSALAKLAEFSMSNMDHVRRILPRQSASSDWQ